MLPLLPIPPSRAPCQSTAVRPVGTRVSAPASSLLKDPCGNSHARLDTCYFNLAAVAKTLCCGVGDPLWHISLADFLVESCAAVPERFGLLHRPLHKYTLVSVPQHVAGMGCMHCGQAFWPHVPVETTMLLFYKTVGGCSTNAGQHTCRTVALAHWACFQVKYGCAIHDTAPHLPSFQRWHARVCTGRQEDDGVHVCKGWQPIRAQQGEAQPGRPKHVAEGIV